MDCRELRRKARLRSTRQRKTARFRTAIDAGVAVEVGRHGAEEGNQVAEHNGASEMGFGREC
jgi:hypothetical protein